MGGKSAKKLNIEKFDGVEQHHEPQAFRNRKVDWKKKKKRQKRVI